MSAPELRWSDAQEVPTKFGPRLLRKAAPTYEFVQYYEANAQQMRMAGYTLAPDRYTQRLTACHWATIPKERLLERQAVQEASRAADAVIDIPCPAGRTLRGYQRAGVAYILSAWARGISGVLLGDDPGLGKTPQAIACINAEPKISRVLIICPAKLRQNWSIELSRWLVRKMSVGTVEGRCFPSSDIVLCSFEMVHKFPNHTGYFWDLVIVDEAHRCKSKDTIRNRHIFGWRSRGKDAKSISPIPTRRKLALTGTPIPNKVMEIFPILNWLDAKRWDNQFKFGLRYCEAIKTRFGWTFNGATNLQELREVLRGTILCRRLKRDVMVELPAKTRIIVELESNLTTNEQREWDEMLKRIGRRDRDITAVNGEDFAARASILEDDLQIAFDQMAEFRHRAALAKVDPFVEDVIERMEELDKVIVFGHHSDCIDRLMIAFKQFNPVQIVGATRNPQAASSRFQSDPTCRMIIGSDSMMEGHTLTAASTVLFFEGDWTPGRLTQKEDRCIMEGQLVLTRDRGLVPIERIVVGDHVLTHIGNWKAVTETHSRIIRAHETISEIHYQRFHQPLCTTGDHSILVKRGAFQPAWMIASDVRPRDLLCMPRPKTEIEFPKIFEGVPINEETMSLFGWYLAEGYCSSPSDRGRFVSIVVHQKERYVLERIKQTFSTIGMNSTIRDHSKKAAIELRACSNRVSDWFAKTFGRTCKEKKIPSWIMHGSSESVRPLVEGYFSGDGERNREHQKWVTSSRILAAQIAQLIARWGISFGLHTEINEAGTEMWRGRYALGQGNRPSGDADENYIYYLVTDAINRIGPKTCGKRKLRVHDLTVEDDHSFVVGLSAVHNCHRFGQTDNVFCLYYVLKNSLDARMIRRALAKQEKIDAALDQ